MIVGLLAILLNIGIVVAIVIGVRRLFGTSRGRGTSHGVQEIFQYAIAFGLLVIVAVGLSGLLATAITFDSTIVSNQSTLARNVSFTVVGLPFLTGMLLWIRRRFASDQDEGQGIAAVLFMLGSSITSLVVVMSAAIGVLYWAIGVSEYQANQVAQLIVWLTVWTIFWIVQSRFIPSEHLQVHYLLGAFIGLITSAVGLIRLISGIISELVAIAPPPLASSSTRPILQALALSTVGVTVWVIYWIGRAMNSKQSPLWFAYVLLLGVGGGLIAAVVSASTVIYRTLVWYIGQPVPDDAVTFFKSLPTSAAVMIVGIITWWYHRSMLGTKVQRTEVQRVYSYLISGIGLISSAIGLTITLVALVEAFVKQSVLVGTGAFNTLLAALTAILVGVPVWLTYWISIQRHVKHSPQDELTSPTRRTYLYALFGVGGIAAIISLVTGVFQFLDDLFNNRLDISTLRDMRYSIGVLLSTASIALYHWLVYRHEREVSVQYGSRAKVVTLVGIADADLVKIIADRSGARVRLLVRTDDIQTAWPVDRVIELISQANSHRLLIINDATGPFVIPIKD